MLSMPPRCWPPDGAREHSHGWSGAEPEVKSVTDPPRTGPNGRRTNPGSIRLNLKNAAWCPSAKVKRNNALLVTHVKRFANQRRDRPRYLAEHIGLGNNLKLFRSANRQAQLS